MNLQTRNDQRKASGPSRYSMLPRQALSKIVEQLELLAASGDDEVTRQTVLREIRRLAEQGLAYRR